MAASASHWDVAAYVLGALSPPDTDAFEEHLGGCDVCADEVEFLLPTVGRLAGIDAAEAIAAHAATAPDRLASPVDPAGRDGESGSAPGPGRRSPRAGGTARSVRRRAVPRDVVRRTVMSADSAGKSTSSVSRDLVRRAMAGPAALHRRPRPTPRHGQLGAPVTGRRNTILASVILVLVAALAFAAGSQFSRGGDAIAAGDSPPPRAVTSPTASTPATPAEQLEATNPATGVHATLAITGTSWGSQVELTVGGVRGPLWCELVAIDHDGKSIVVASWTVHSPGYGIPADPELLTIQAATAVTLRGTDHFDIHAIDAHGAESTLVSLLV